MLSLKFNTHASPAFWEAIRKDRQLHLGRSQGTLCIARDLPSTLDLPSLRPDGPCFISMLPDELLVKILENFRPGLCHIDDHTKEYLTEGQALLIPRVCRRWHEIFIPMLYQFSAIELMSKLRGRSQATVKLFRSLERSNHFVRHLRELHVDGDGWEQSLSTRLANVVLSCDSLRRVDIHLDLEGSAWPFVHAVSRSPCLEDLKLRCFSLQIIYLIFDLVTLKRLRLYDFSSKICWGPDSLGKSGDCEETEKIANTVCGGPSKVTELELHVPMCHPSATCLLIRWPTSLTKISLHVGDSSYKLQYNVSTVQRLLDIHRETLRHIRLGLIHPSDTMGIPSFARFRSLETLELFGRNLMENESAISAAEKLRTPSLRHLTIIFRNTPLHEIRQTDFGEDRITWLEEMFAVLQADTSSFTMSTNLRSLFTISTNLRSLFVDFDPLLDDLDLSWPWQYMVKAVEVLARRGVCMKHLEPWLSRKQWFRLYGGPIPNEDVRIKEDKMDDNHLAILRLHND